MISRTIKPPKFLHDIHGNSTTLFDIILTYMAGLISIVSIYILYLQNHMDSPVWKLVLLLIISADIGAGVVANFTKGTNSYYGGEGKSKLRIVFILSHVFHAAIFLYASDLFSIKTVGLACFVIMSTLIINAIRNKEGQKVGAAFSMVVGVGAILILEISNPLLLWFFPLYMTKLFIAFGIRRY